MSGSEKDEQLFPEDQPLKISKGNPPLPTPGYGLIFRESLALEIAELVSSPLFKTLKRVYGLQAKDRAARLCINGAQNAEWLMYYKGVAASAQLFFKDLEEVRDNLNAQNTPKEDRKFKK